MVCASSRIHGVHSMLLLRRQSDHKAEKTNERISVCWPAVSARGGLLRAMCARSWRSITERKCSSNIPVGEVYGGCHLDDVEERVVCIVVGARCILGIEL